MNIIELIKTTAENQYTLMMQMADYIEQMEKEIAQLKGADNGSDRNRS